MMAFEPLHQDFGARVVGVDLSAPLDEGAVAALHDAVDRYSVLHFPDQEMTDDAQLALTRQLGEPEEGHVTFGIPRSSTGWFERIRTPETRTSTLVLTPDRSSDGQGSTAAA